MALSVPALPRLPKLPQRRTKTATAPTEDLPVSELVDLVRSDRPLLKKLGWRDSAVFHPDVMKRQYQRAANFFGYLGIGPYCLAAAFLVLACLGIAGVFHGFWTWEKIIPNQSPMAELPRWLGLAVGFGCGVPIGLAGVGSILSTLRWDTTYCDGLVIQQAGPSKNLLLEAFQRLVFADRQIGRFKGDESEGGFAKSKRMVMRTGVDIPTSSSPQDFYDGDPSSSGFIGNHAAIIKALVNTPVEAGKAAQEFNQLAKKRGLGLDPVGNGGLVICVILILLAAGVQCVGVDTSALAGSVMENLPYAE